ncbi:mite allergen Der p 3-like [Chironomus tepperi]|uniref:mite allergen Der p 3-like n=1 Tax=Chironomus tepperi TaxID=113505 RepID=UPI00391FC23C
MKIFQNVYSNRIAFGEPASIGDFPHMLAMISATTEGFVCGASIIHKLWALTAAHCVASLHPYHVKFRGGSVNRQSGGSVFTIENFWIHHQFDDWRLAFDIAVVKVSDSTPMEGINIKAIQLPPSCDVLCCGVCTGIEVTASGMKVC